MRRGETSLFPRSPRLLPLLLTAHLICGTLDRRLDAVWEQFHSHVLRIYRHNPGILRTETKSYCFVNVTYIIPLLHM